MSETQEIAVFGGGCFWCTEAIFKELKGVTSVTSGYAGGNVENPTYEQVSEGTTGHAEVIKIEFDPSVIPYRDLLDVFWHTHNPMTLNQQGADRGKQYRSIVLYTSSDQKQIAESMKKELTNSGEFEKPIVTEIAPLTTFFEAEGYHKDYYEKNSNAPYCELIISPKLTHLRQKYSSKLKIA